MKKKAKFWKKLNEDKEVRCNLCYQSCKIKEGNIGFCGVRKNIDGSLYSLIYGSASSVAVDPIEKKPLYNFHPGTNALSLGTVGCNFKCLHCQNASISQVTPDDFPYMNEFTSEQVVELAKQRGCEGIAWTYNEPTIWHEFSYDTAKLANKEGLYNVYVSNGFIQEEPLREISPYLDALNIDIKAFEDKFYKDICQARLKPVLRTCELAKELEIHLEVTYLVIPGYNDSDKQLKDFCSWVVNKLGVDTPVHFSRFYPDHKMRDVPMTPMETMKKAYNLAKDTGLNYTYLGNVLAQGFDNTFCPKCGNTCISRSGYSIDMDGIQNRKCKSCGAEISIVT